MATDPPALPAELGGDLTQPATQPAADTSMNRPQPRPAPAAAIDSGQRFQRTPGRACEPVIGAADGGAPAGPDFGQGCTACMLLKLPGGLRFQIYKPASTGLYNLYSKKT